MLSFSFLLLTSTSLSVFAAAFHCCNSPFHPAQLLALHCAWPCTGCASRTSAFTHSTDPPFPCALPADVSACTSWLQSLFSRHPSIFSPTCSLHGAPCCFLIAGVQPPCSLPPSSCRWTCSLLLSAASLPSAQRNLPTHMGSLLVVAYTDLLLPGACCGFFCTVTTFILHPQFSILLLLQWAALEVFAPRFFLHTNGDQACRGWKTSFLFAASRPWTCVNPRAQTSSLLHCQLPTFWHFAALSLTWVKFLLNDKWLPTCICPLFPPLLRWFPLCSFTWFRYFCHQCVWGGTS